MARSAKPRAATGSRDLRLEQIGRTDAKYQRSVVRWTEAGGTVRHVTIVLPPTGAVAGALVDNDIVWALGAWTAMLAFVGALVEWGRVAKAWRRPPRRHDALAAGSTTIVSGA